MLWTISSDAEPHQQCALVISQLGGAAREVARTLLLRCGKEEL